MERHTVTKILRYSTIGLLGLVILSYASYQSQNLIKGPVITITEPQNGLSFSQSLIEIDGKTTNVTTIDLDGRPIFVDEKGNFKEKYLLSPGYNIITITASDKFGRSAQKTLELIYPPSS